jgi:DUF2934 family protein
VTSVKPTDSALKAVSPEMVPRACSNSRISRLSNCVRVALPRPVHHSRTIEADLYEECGRDDGHEMDDWLRTEEEITNKNACTVAA